jgi:hypothetical protein
MNTRFVERIDTLLEHQTRPVLIIVLPITTISRGMRTSTLIPTISLKVNCPQIVFISLYMPSLELGTQEMCLHRATDRICDLHFCRLEPMI